MPRFAANISTMFTDRPFADRIGAAAAAGFKAVECQFPYEVGAGELKQRLAEAGVELILLNTPPGDFAAGERGLAGLPGREADFRAALERALDYAQALDCPKIHVMAGIRPEGASKAECLEVYKASLRRAAEACARAGRMALIEPINTRDIPGYLLNTPAEGAALIAELGLPALRLQFDFYHTQIMAGDLARNFERHQKITGHVQIAGVPERHEPDIGRDQLSSTCSSCSTGWATRTGWAANISRPAAPRRASAGRIATASRPSPRCSPRAANGSEACARRRSAAGPRAPGPRAGADRGPGRPPARGVGASLPFCATSRWSTSSFSARCCSGRTRSARRRARDDRDRPAGRSRRWSTSRRSSWAGRCRRTSGSAWCRA